MPKLTLDNVETCQALFVANSFLGGRCYFQDIDLSDAEFELGRKSTVKAVTAKIGSDYYRFTEQNAGDFFEANREFIPLFKNQSYYADKTILRSWGGPDQNQAILVWKCADFAHLYAGVAEDFNAQYWRNAKALDIWQRVFPERSFYAVNVDDCIIEILEKLKQVNDERWHHQQMVKRADLGVAHWCNHLHLAVIEKQNKGAV